MDVDSDQEMYDDDGDADEEQQAGGHGHADDRAGTVLKGAKHVAREPRAAQRRRHADEAHDAGVAEREPQPDELRPPTVLD